MVFRSTTNVNPANASLKYRVNHVVNTTEESKMMKNGLFVGIAAVQTACVAANVPGMVEGYAMSWFAGIFCAAMLSYTIIIWSKYW